MPPRTNPTITKTWLLPGAKLIMGCFILSGCSFDIPNIDYSAAHLEEAENEFDQALFESYRLDDGVLAAGQPDVKAQEALVERFVDAKSPENIKLYLVSIGANCEVEQASNICSYSQYIEQVRLGFLWGSRSEYKMNVDFTVEFPIEHGLCCNLQVTSRFGDTAEIRHR